MKIYKTLLLIVVIGLTACSKKNENNVTTVRVTVKDGVTGKAVSGATINLYAGANDAISGTPKYSQVTDQSGNAKITVTYVQKLFVMAKYNTQQNFYNGLIPVGIFTDQTDINDSPGQTPAGVVGGVKFQDTNGDGIINSADDVSLPAITLTANTNNTFSTTIY